MGHQESTTHAFAVVLRLATLGILIVISISSVHAQSSQSTVNITATVPAAGNGGGGGSSGGGGGGGGGGGAVPEGKATVIFTGRAYPGSTVTILQNGIRRGTTIAGSDATFAFTLERVAAGNHSFVLYSTDRRGVRSASQSYPIRITSGLITTISGIFIAPTLTVSREQVRNGEPITLLGQTSPTGDVTITVNSAKQHILQAKADGAGLYAYTFITTPLEDGAHEAQARTSLAGTVSGLSNVARFSVGAGATGTPGTCVTGDLNCDGSVNLVDFSIIAFWFKKPTPPARMDLNGDKAVTLIDFSILAYHWTG